MSDHNYIGFSQKDVAIVRASIPAGAKRALDVRVMAEELRRQCKKNNLNLGVCWSQINHEVAASDGQLMFRSDVWQTRCNPAGIKSRSGGAYMRYYNGVDAARAYLSHLSAYLPGYGLDHLRNDELDPRWNEARRLAVSTPREERPELAAVAQYWAEDAAYERHVRMWYARLFTVAPHFLPVLLVAGHRNFDGGNETERGWTDDLARAYLAECKARGIRADWLQQHDGDGDPDDTLGGLWSVATLCNDWLSRQADGGIMLDLHFEGGGRPGIFCVYPDWPGDDGNAIDQAYARTISARIARAVGLDVRRSGVTEPGAMSERQTGVGGQGYRLGMFNLTVNQRHESIRLVVEHGSHDQNPDAAKIRSMGIEAYARAAARGAVAAIAELQNR